MERHRPRRPWLETAERASPEALRIIVAADLGGGHGHIRHEGWVRASPVARLASRGSCGQGFAMRLGGCGKVLAQPLCARLADTERCTDGMH